MDLKSFHTIKTRLAGRSGFTLLEVMVATVIFAIVVLGTGSMTVGARKHIIGLANKRFAMRQANSILERLTRLDTQSLMADTQGLGALNAQYYQTKDTTPGVDVLDGECKFVVAHLKGYTFSALAKGIKTEETTAGGRKYYILTIKLTIDWGTNENETFELSTIKSA